MKSLHKRRQQKAPDPHPCAQALARKLRPTICQESTIHPDEIALSTATLICERLEIQLADEYRWRP